MKNTRLNHVVTVALCSAGLLAATTAWTAPRTISLYAKVVWINPITGSTGDSQGTPAQGRIPMWGFATSPGGTAQVPGPRIDVSPSQYADGLVITVFNQLSEPISVVIPGLNGSTDTGQPVKFGAGDPNYPNRVRSLVPVVPAGGSRAFTWNGPLKVGTFAYHSGSHPALQVQMGLYGMVTVKSSDNQPYPGINVAASREVPVIFSEIDTNLHWAVQNGSYGPGQAVSSTIHSDPNMFLINGRAYSKANPPANLLGNGARGQQTLFRMINFCWDSRIPVLVGPIQTGNVAVPGGTGGANYLTQIAEDGNRYPFAKTAYAPNLAAMKSMDVLFTPPNPGPAALTYMFYDHRLGLSNPTGPDGGMYAKWMVTQ